MNTETITEQTDASSGSLPTVAIVGRPNVGKSALFNRLVGGRVALVEDMPGTTRDRIYGEVDRPRRPFRLIDTGGLEVATESGYPALIRAQIRLAIDEADAIIFAVDVRDGLTAADHEVADLLRRASLPVVLAANKADNLQRGADLAQFYELGFGDPIPVSAYHDRGISDLLDGLDQHLPISEEANAPETLKIAIVGRPNVGKSALLNAVLGEERVIVSSVPGTTRDAVDTSFRFEERDLVLIDTAGIRRRGQIEVGVEKHSVLRAQQAIERADVALCVMEARELLTAQDTHIIGLVEQAYRSLVIVINKIDLIERTGEWRQDLTRLVRYRVKFAPWAEVAFVSALEHTGIDEVVVAAVRAGDARHQRAATPRLNTVLRRAMTRHSPPSMRGKRLKVFYATQPEVAPPTFVLFVNDPDLVHFAYERYLENTLREAFGFRGTPIRLRFKKRGAEE